MDKIIKRGIIILFLLLLSLPLISARTIVSGWYNSGGNFTVEGVYYYLAYSKSQEKIVITADSTHHIVDLGSCKTVDVMEYCFDAVDYETRVKYEGGKELPGVSITINELEAAITITRSISKKTLEYDEEADFSVTLKNNGDLDIENIVYTDSFPSGIMFLNSNAEDFGNGVKWSGRLSAGQEKIITYKIKMMDYISYESIAKLTYQFGGAAKEIKSSPITIAVSKPYAISDYISNVAFDTDQIIRYNVNVTNQKENTLKITKLSIEIPKRVRVVEAEGLTAAENILAYKGELAANGRKEFAIRLATSVKGEYKITTKAEFSANNKPFHDEISKTFSVGLTSITPILTLIPSTLKSNEMFNVSLDLYNKEDVDMQNINAVIESSLIQTVNLTGIRVNSKQTSNVYKKSIKAPNANKTEVYSIKATGDFFDERKGLTPFKIEKKLTVEPQEKYVDIMPVIETIERGANNTVKVYLKNMKKDSFSVSLIDIVPKGFPTYGTRTNEFSIGGNEKKLAYSYDIMVPQNYSSDSFIIKSLLNIDLPSGLYVLQKETELKIGEERIAVVDENISEEEAITEGNTTKEENITIGEGEEVIVEEEIKEEKAKENFFKKIISWFKGLFSGPKEKAEE